MRLWFGLVAALFAAGPVLAGPFGDAGYDPILMLAWATEVDEAVRGPLDIANPGLGNASFGVPENALGAATGGLYDVVALGDGGYLTLFFEGGISDGVGDDFAVYENGFISIGGMFAEFAFVEVSSNGSDFARFDTTSLHSTLVPGSGVVDPTDYENFGGDQIAGLGTGFDLAELVNDPLVVAGSVDLHDVSYVRVIDVIGDGSTLDGQGLPIYDPYPTFFASGGFDVGAIGVIHPVPEPDVLAGLIAGGLWIQWLGRRTRRCARLA